MVNNEAMVAFRWIGGILFVLSGCVLFLGVKAIVVGAAKDRVFGRSMICVALWFAVLAGICVVIGMESGVAH